MKTANYMGIKQLKNDGINFEHLLEPPRTAKSVTSFYDLLNLSNEDFSADYRFVLIVA